MQKKILVINFGGLGDQILFLPTIKTLKKKYENAFVTLITESRSKAINELTDLVDEVCICDLKKKNNFPELIKFFKKAYSGGYSLVVSSGSSSSIAVLLMLTGIKERIGYDSGRLSKVLLTSAVKLNKNQYAADMYHDLVSDEKTNVIPEISIQAKNNQLENKNIKTVVIHPGVSKLSVEKNFIKFWSNENWVKLVEKLLSDGNYKIILTGGPDDAEAMAIFRQRFPDNIANTKNIKEFAQLVDAADILVCVDSAPMHVGVGLKKRVIAIFGPTDEKKLLPSNNDLFTPVIVSSLKCRPCLWDVRKESCETKECLNISPDHIFEMIKGSGVTGDFDRTNA